MIVCSCNIISRRDIEEAIEAILAEDSHAVLTPGLIYHRLGKRGKCGGCFPHAVDIMVEHGNRVRARLVTGESAGQEDDAPESRPIYLRAVAAE